MKRGVLIRFCLATAVLVLGVAALNLFGDWTLEMMPIKFVGVALCAGFAYLFAVSNFPAFTVRKSAVTFWVIAIVLRLLVIALPPSDDLWRFIWDGKIQNAGGDPYVSTPDETKWSQVREGFDDWSRVRKANASSTFAPGAELLFRVGAAISDRPLFWKLLFGCADLAVAALLLLICRGEGRYQRVVWYAWNPLVVYSFAGSAHFDSLLLVALTAAILFLERNEGRPGWQNAITAAALFGVASSINFVAALIFLPFAFALRQRAIALLVSAAIPLGCASLFGFPQVHLANFAGDLLFNGRLNDLFWWLIEETYWPNAHQRNFIYLVPLIGAALLVSLACWRNWRKGILWTLGITLILMPVLNAWYCTWIIPVATWRRSYVWHVLSVTIFAYYLFWNERLFRLPWHAEPWMRGIIIFPPLIAAISVLRRRAQNEPTLTEIADE